MRIPLARPDIRTEDISLVEEVLRSGMLVQGKYVRNLEEKIATILGTRDAVAVTSGTATLHMILTALEIGPGDEVIIPAFSFVATANVVELVGATPVFVDIELKSYNIALAQIEEKITGRTKAIMPVHEFGLPCDIIEIKKIAQSHDLVLIEDAACALGAMYNGQAVGTFGDFASFSMHPRKMITSGEGGILVAKDQDMSDSLRALRNHGLQKNNEGIEVIHPGYNYRMTDFQAALAVGQLTRFSNTLEKRRELADIYLELLSSCNLQLPNVPDKYLHSWQTFHVLLEESMSRPVFIEKLANKGIGSNLGAQCIPMQKYYREKYSFTAADFPNAYRAFTKGVALPLYERLGEEEIMFVSKTIRNIC